MNNTKINKLKEETLKMLVTDIRGIIQNGDHNILEYDWDKCLEGERLHPIIKVDTTKDEPILTITLWGVDK